MQLHRLHWLKAGPAATVLSRPEPRPDILPSTIHSRIMLSTTRTDLYLRIVAPRNLFIEFIHEVRSATRLALRERGKV